MKNIIASLFLILLTTGCISQKKNEQNYLTVEAQRRIYRQNGVVTYSSYEPFKTRTVELLSGYKSPKRYEPLSKYGGGMGNKVESTGFFRTEKIGDRWWCVDPDGYLYFNVALNSISRGGSERNEQALKDKFGTSENWITETVKMLQENGFNCAGSWSDYKSIIEANKGSDKPFAYTINWNFMSSYGRERGGTFQQSGHIGYPGDAIFVFDPEWETFCDRHAQQAAAYKDDPNLFGYFSDNEMPFKFKSLDNYLALPVKDHGHIAAMKWITDQGITREQITDSHREAFMSVVADRYPTATGVDPSNTDSNKGIVNNYYEVWTPMMELMKELNTNVYSIIEHFDKK